MSAVKSMFKKMFSFATSETSLQTIWEHERRRAAMYGPSHVSEVDAIFQRQI